CTVPGCGATSTTSCNLKGHLRAHCQERPFECRLPGCRKIFVGRHDCKRHEKLHIERSFECKACNKKFAWIESFNRHLSVAGSECASVTAQLYPGQG
ncbi:hypothetical protein B0H34DRAFT_661301, partial [Crassisporium funariophilum]